MACHSSWTAKPLTQLFFVGTWGQCERGIDKRRANLQCAFERAGQISHLFLPMLPGIDCRRCQCVLIQALSYLPHVFSVVHTCHCLSDTGGIVNPVWTRGQGAKGGNIGTITCRTNITDVRRLRSCWWDKVTFKVLRHDYTSQGYFRVSTHRLGKQWFKGLVDIQSQFPKDMVLARCLVCERATAPLSWPSWSTSLTGTVAPVHRAWAIFPSMRSEEFF